ncbi:hypothetical protein ACHWQZ_G004796 [Mnemiopsis leidyi]
MSHKPTTALVQYLEDKANEIRILSIECTNASKSGHPTSCMSAAEIFSVLFFNEMRYDNDYPKHPSSDRFILSKGHAAPGLYSAWCAAGLFDKEKLLTLRKIDSDLEGHPTPRLNFIDAATGSLGQGLSVAAGMAYIGKHIEHASYRTYCLIGDGESAEGSIWEALSFASHYKLDNLVAIFDINRLGQSEAAPLEHDMDVYRKRVEAFGFHTMVVDGHSVEEILKALEEAKSVKNKPCALICKTYKGHGSSDVADKLDFHGKALNSLSDKILAEIKGKMHGAEEQPRPKINDDAPQIVDKPVAFKSALEYEQGKMIATRVAYGDALVKLGEASDKVVVLDADTKNSTYALKFKNAFPDRYIECFIAEQNMVGVSLGCGARNRTIPFCSTFATFFTRAMDQIRMAAVSQSQLNMVGSHCGVSIGEDGPSQMALEDIAAFRAIPNLVYFYPSDAVSACRAVELAANYKHMTFIRTSRPATPVIYANDETFEIGKAKIVKESAEDKVLVIGAGITLDSAMKAHSSLQGKGTNIRVMDPFTIKPLDKEAVLKHAKECGGRVITVEDHYPEGGIGEAVAAVLSDADFITKHKMLAVREIPRSGPPAVLLDMFGISANKVEDAVMDLIE